MKNSEVIGRKVKATLKGAGERPYTTCNMGKITGKIIDVGFDSTEECFMFLVQVDNKFYNVPSADCELIED